MGMRYNPPPNWPAPPPGWTPPPGWRPDPSWGPAPPGWQVWVHDGVAYPHAAQPHRYVPYQQPSRHGYVPHGAPTAPHHGSRPSSNAGSVMIAVAAATCGLAGFVPPLWAARQRPDDARFRRRMYAVAATSAVMAILGFALVGSADEDATGSPTGVLSGIGSALVLINLAVSVTVAVLVRNTRPAAPLPGVAEELARRQLREQYRQVAINDPSLARSMGIGRPDLSRNIDDGGLLDLNSIPAEKLGPLTGLTAEEATRVADARVHLGRFLGLEDLAVYADLPDATIDMLRERAVFYGR